MNPLLVGTLGLGMGVLASGPSSPPPRPSAAQASFGFTAPTDIYEVMRQIQTSAAALDPDVTVNVADPAFRRAWASWFLEWRAFFDANYRTFKTLLHTDELKGQVETYRSQLLSWYEGYQRQTTTAGKPVPAPSGIPPFRPPPESGGGASLLPWWAWVLGGVALVGVGYLGYRHYVKAQATKRVLETEVLPGLIGAPLARAASARDPDGDSDGRSAGRQVGRSADRDYVLTNFDRERDMPAWYLEGQR